MCCNTVDEGRGHPRCLADVAPASPLSDTTIPLASSAQTALMSLGSHYDGVLIARLEANAARAACTISSAVLSVMDIVQQTAPAFALNARRRARVADKLLVLKGEEFEAAVKMFESFLQQCSTDEEPSEDTLYAICRILDALIGFSPVSIIISPAGSGASALLTVEEASRVCSVIDASRCRALHARWLPRGQRSIVTLEVRDSAGEAVLGLCSLDVSCAVEDGSVGWTVLSVAVEGCIVTVRVALTEDCGESTTLRVDVWDTSITIPLQVSDCTCM